MLQSIGLQNVGHDIATEKTKKKETTEQLLVESRAK